MVRVIPWGPARQNGARVQVCQQDARCEELGG